MAATRGSVQSPIVTQRYLNTSTYAGDPTPGAVVQTSQVSGSIVQSYGGQNGGILTLGKEAANYYTDPTYGQQLYAGDYQYVQFYASDSAPSVQGQIVFWLDNATNLLPSGSYIVTNTESASQSGLVAGIALCNTAQGNYWFIQTSGIAQVKFAATQGVTGTPAVGDLLFVDYNSSTPYAFDPVQTGNPTFAQLKAMLGVVWSVQTKSSQIGPVFLGPNPKYYPGGSGGEG